MVRGASPLIFADRDEAGGLLGEEPGALEIVAEEAGAWFAAHLR